MAAFFLPLAASAQPVRQQLEKQAREYDSRTNTHYWKNRKPHAAYWQQDVHYRIEASLDDSTHIISGKVYLLYANNSPDTLHEVFFHLYNNLTKEGSLAHELHLKNGIRPKADPKFEESMGMNISLTLYEAGAKGEMVSIERVHSTSATIKRFKVKPILPGASAYFECAFQTRFENNTVRRRMKYFEHDGVKHFDGVHWYPRMAVYDAHSAWNAYEHLGREFYGNYGTYDVHLTLPAGYVCEATGLLQNKEEVMPASMDGMLALRNWQQYPNIGEVKGALATRQTSTTWHFKAANVHDFAWTADPSYRRESLTWNGVEVVALAQAQNARYWHDAVHFTQKVVELYSNHFGMYDWPKIVTADARDGMEYPMMTLCGGRSPSYYSLIAHETGHQWFMGMVGSNETYRAFLDEGFTQFLTAYSMERLVSPYARTVNAKTMTGIRRRDSLPTRDVQLLNRFLSIRGFDEELPPATHSDYFNDAVGHGGGYSMVYHKAGTMLYNLQYLLGDSLFLHAMQHYVAKWKFAHPYEDDFRKSIVEATGYNLNEFFDQWLHTTKTIDYKVAGVRNRVKGHSEITFRRKGDMHMPVEFTVYYKDGKLQTFRIPDRHSMLPKQGIEDLYPWIGWNQLNNKHKVKLDYQGRIRYVQIDTSYRLADINQLDNRSRLPFRLMFDDYIARPPDRRRYRMYVGATAYFNGIDGLMPGIRIRGNHFNKRHRLDLYAYYNSRVGAYLLPEDVSFRDPLNYSLDYDHPLVTRRNPLTLRIVSRYLDGLSLQQVGLSRQLTPALAGAVSLRSMYRPQGRGVYPLFQTLWHEQMWNNVMDINFYLNKSVSRHAFHSRLTYRNSVFGSDFDYQYLKLEQLHQVPVGKFTWRNRVLLQSFYGAHIAPESGLYLAWANQEEMMETSSRRARGWVYENWLTLSETSLNHTHYGGGLNVRGYAGYLAPFSRNGIGYQAFTGSGGGSYNTEFMSPDLLQYAFKYFARSATFQAYLFGDAGVMDVSPSFRVAPLLSPVYANAGIGFFGSLYRIGPATGFSPLNFRLDIPLLYNRHPDGNIIRPWFVLGVRRAW